MTSQYRSPTNTDPLPADTGANASAEGGDDEGAEDTAKEVINVVSSGLLESTSFDKKSYMAYLKGAFPLPPISFSPQN